MNDETRPLTDLLQKVIDARRGKPLNPAWLAKRGAARARPAPALMRAACLIQLRELAEGLLGKVGPRGVQRHCADVVLLRSGAEADFAHARRLEAWRTGRQASDEGDGPSSA